ncbi:MAG: porin [Treponema sp.]|nr:porin [Treponema sp.]
MRKRLPAGGLLLCVVLPLAAQAGIEPHGSIETVHAFPFSKDRGLTDSRSVFTGEINVFAGEAAAFVSFAAEYNGVSPDRSGFSLGEAWAGWSAAGFSIRLGRQLLSWGAADGLILSDVVCPQNLSAYAGLDFAGSRLAVDGFRLRYSFPALAVEAVWLPLFTPARLPEDPQNPLYGIFYPATVNAGGISLPVWTAAAVLPRGAADGEYGLRLSAYTPALDFSLAAFYGWNDIPYTGKALTQAGVQVTPEYGRTITAGADASIPLGAILLRLEAAWTGGGRYDRTSAHTAAALLAGKKDQPIEKHRLQALAGIDYNPAGWTLSLQYYEDLLPGARGETERPWRKNALTLRIARGLFRETLNLSAWCYLDLSDFDTAGSVSAAYALTDELNISLGTDFFTGGIDKRGSYAAYQDLSAVWVKGIFRF